MIKNVQNWMRKNKCTFARVAVCVLLHLFHDSKMLHPPTSDISLPHVLSDTIETASVMCTLILLQNSSLGDPIQGEKCKRSTDDGTVCEV